MSIDLNAIRQKLQNLQTTTDTRKQLWKPKPGTQIIRIVPYKDNRENPFIELFFHYNLGKKSYLSLQTFGEEDPIADFSEEMKQRGNATKDKDMWKLGKRMEPTLRTYVPIIVRGEEKEGVKFWGFGKSLYTELLGIIADPDYGDITDLQTGRDITVTYTAPVKEGEWGDTKILVKPNVSPVTTDKEIAKLIKEQASIFDIFKKSTYAELKKVLEDYINDKEDTKGEVSAEEQIDKVAKEQSKTKQEKEIDAIKPSALSDKKDIEDEFEKMFQDLK